MAVIVPRLPVMVAALSVQAATMSKGCRRTGKEHRAYAKSWQAHSNAPALSGFQDYDSCNHGSINFDFPKMAGTGVIAILINDDVTTIRKIDRYLIAVPVTHQCVRTVPGRDVEHSAIKLANRHSLASVAA